MSTATGLFNLRIIGGARPWLVRCGAPDAITLAGIDALEDAGVSIVIDLREPEEVTTAAVLPVRNIPLYGAPAPQEGTLEDIYESLLRERGEALVRAVEEVAQAEGAALVHCTAGKDRTGLVVALARLAAGHTHSDVITDYALSGPEVAPQRQAHAELAAATSTDPAQTLRLHLDSPAEALEHALTVIDEFGSATGYLLAHGATNQTLTALRAKAQS